ncbi:MAG: GFA family protein [Pseudomonadota bacterium]
MIQNERTAEVKMIEGGCFCGEIRYTIQNGDYIVANCHCTMCRRTSAAPFVTWVVAPKTAFTYTKGQPKLLQSSDQGKRYFCDACGTPLACEIGERADDIDITTCSLDNPNDFVPKLAVHEDTKLHWLSQTEG